MFGERDVTVRLKLAVREYLAGGNAADQMNRRLIASQDELGASAKRAGVQVDDLGAKSERSGRRAGRGLLYTAAGMAALGAAGGGLKVLPPLLTAAATGAAVLPQILLGSAAAGGVLKASLSGVGDELKKITKAQDQFSKPLAANAQKFVNQYARVRPVLQGLQQGLQQNAFAGTAQGLDLIVSKTLPKVSTGLDRIATDWSHLFAEMALTASSPEFVGAFNTVTRTADRFFDQFNNRIRPLSKSISTLITSADPVARAFGTRLMGMLDRFNASVENAKRSGSLAKVFEAGTEAANELMMISEDVLRITGMVIREASATNSAGTSAAQSLRAYVESGRAAGDVAGIVHTLTTAWEGLRDVMAPLGAVLRDTLSNSGVASSLAQTFQVFAVGAGVIATMLRLLLSLNEAFGGLLLPLIGLAMASGKVTAAIAATTAAAAKGSAALTKYGAAGAAAGKGLTSVAAGAGKLVGALFILEAVHQIFAQFDDASADVDKLAASVERLAKTGKISGEVGRVFNKGWSDMATQAQMVDPQDWFGKFLAGAEKAIPITGDLARAFGAPSFVQSTKNYADLDASMTKYASTTNDLKGTTEAWNQVSKETNLGHAELAKLLPTTYAEMGRLQTETHNLETGMDGAAARTALLAAPLREAVTAGRSLLDVFTELNGGTISFAKAQLAAEAAVDTLTEGLKENGLALTRGGTDFDIHKKKGAENLGMLISVGESAAAAAQKRKEEGGSIYQVAAVYDQYINRARAALALQGATPKQIDAIINKYAAMPASVLNAADSVNTLNGKLKSIPKGTKFVFDGKSMVDGYGQTIELKDGVKGIPQGKTFRWNGKDLVDGKGKAVALKEAIDNVPKNPKIKAMTDTGQAMGSITALEHRLDMLNGKVVTTTVRTVQTNGNIRVSGPGGSGTLLKDAQGGVHLPRQRGGVRVAASGLLQPEIAPPGTRYQWAEPETGGELFLPRKGINRRRGQDLLGVAAEWYDMRVTPRAQGGVRAAASGLVNMAPASDTGTRASRLDFAESYTQARDAVKGLSTALKENGSSFSWSTVKGRENRQALYGVMRAAQDVAKTKFEETGNVRLANRAYDEHIRRLRATLAQQKVNSTTIRGLMALAQRPTYDTGAQVKNSATRVAFARSSIAAAGGIEDLRDALSLNKATVGLGSKEGRDNLSGILDFLGQAQQAAQDQYVQSGSPKRAATLYNGYVGQLRQSLSSSGYSKKAIDSIISAYGRITLSKNARGGIHHAASGLVNLSPASAGVYPGKATLYGFAEASTGGEAFIPRNGDRRRGRELVDTAAGWYGGRFAPSGAGGAGGGSTTINNTLNVTPLTYNPTTTELLGYQRQLDAAARVGRRS
jgi:hypothetical protein